MNVAKTRNRQVIESFLTEADLASGRGEVSNAWALLAKAHVISQPFAWPHTLVHWRMLSLALRTRNFREIAGQIFRLLVAAPGSVFKKYPKGNPGTSDVSAFQPMPISTEVQTIIDRLRTAKR
jgi:hypothetical protein